MIKYEKSEELTRRITEIAAKLEMEHDFSRIVCIESTGSAAKRTLARCHALPRVMQTALDTKAHYVIEVISEQFVKLNKEHQDKTLIHELMHIPKAFGGGFRQHDYVCTKNINKMYEKLQEELF
jgi:predicted metallopeptidase